MGESLLEGTHRQPVVRLVGYAGAGLIGVMALAVIARALADGSAWTWLVGVDMLFFAALTVWTFRRIAVDGSRATSTTRSVLALVSILVWCVMVVGHVLLGWG